MRSPSTLSNTHLPSLGSQASPSPGGTSGTVTATYLRTKTGKRTKLARITEMSKADLKKQETFKQIQYALSKPRKEDQPGLKRSQSILDYITGETDELPLELRVDTHGDTDSIQFDDGNEPINSLRETEKFRTKEYFDKVRNDLDTNDLYNNATKLRQLYKLVKENNIPEERLSKRVQ